MKFLKEARAKARLTQHEVAIALGVTDSSVRNWETGKCRPRKRDREALARLFGDASLIDKLSELQRTA